MATFQSRHLDITFKLASGEFDDAKGADAVLISGLRVSAEIEVAGGGFASANIMIFGLSQSLINRLTTLKTMNAAASIDTRNKVMIETVDEKGYKTFVFEGGIITAMADYNSAPDVPFIITAMALYDARLRVIKPKSYKGAVPAASIMRDLAGEAGLAFENNGVDVILRDVYLSGSVFDMIVAVADQANIDTYIDGGVFAITKKNEPRTQHDAIVMAADSGLVGWPVPTDIGCDCTALYSPSYRIGSKILVISEDVPVAAGERYIYRMVHRLESEMPHGSWFSMMALSIYPQIQSNVQEEEQ